MKSIDTGYSLFLTELSINHKFIAAYSSIILQERLEIVDRAVLSWHMDNVLVIRSIILRIRNGIFSLQSLINVLVYVTLICDLFYRQGSIVLVMIFVLLFCILL